MPPRPRGTRRPHTDAMVAAVRRLIEETTLSYHQIAARTGVSPASISRWMNKARGSGRGSRRALRQRVDPARERLPQAPQC